MGKLNNVGLAHVLEEMVSRVITLGGKPKGQLQWETETAIKVQCRERQWGKA